MSTPVKQNSSNAYNVKILADACNVNDVLKNQILGKRLGELVSASLVTKSQNTPAIPNQVYYAITGKGNALLRIIHELHEWDMQEW